MAARPGTIAADIEADNRNPQLAERLRERLRLLDTARTVAAARTAAQIRGCRKHYGIRSALAATTWCPECGALPGFVHPASCTTNEYPHLGLERAEITAAIEASVHV